METKSSLTTYTTQLSVSEVLDRIENILKRKGITVFARINHGRAAHEVGLDMQDEELIIFGNPKAGTPLMLESPAIGIELPLKIIAWQENQKTFVGIQNVDRLIRDYNIPNSINIIDSFNNFLSNIAEEAIKNN
jgi:uncharacterized protein (DUF302 family)